MLAYTEFSRCGKRLHSGAYRAGRDRILHFPDLGESSTSWVHAVRCKYRTNGRLIHLAQTYGSTES